MNIQITGAMQRARLAPPPGGGLKPSPRACGEPPFSIPVEELRRLVADMVD